jgi:hypothetical protein
VSVLVILLLLLDVLGENVFSSSLVSLEEVSQQVLCGLTACGKGVEQTVSIKVEDLDI